MCFPYYMLQVLCNQLILDHNWIAYQMTSQSKTPIWNQLDLKKSQGVFKSIASLQIHIVGVYECMKTCGK